MYNMQYKRYLPAILLALLSACAVKAQQRMFTLDECVAKAIDTSFGLQSSRKSVERSQSMVATAWDLPKTTLTLSQDPTSGGSPDNAVSIGQEMEFPTLYIARRRQLKAETKVEESRYAVAKTTLVAEVEGCYWRLVYMNSRIRILSRQDSLLAAYRHMVQQRFDAGDIRRLELLSAERLCNDNRMSLDAARSEAETVRLQLAQLTGENGADVADTQLPVLPLPSAPFNAGTTPDALLATDRLTAADRAVAVAKGGYAPSLSLSLRNQLVITGWDPYRQNRSRFSEGNFMGFEVGVGVPLFYGATKARVKAAKKEKEMLQMDAQASRQRQEYEYCSAMSKCDAHYRRVEYYQREGIAKADEMERLALLEYQNGEISYLEYGSAIQECLAMRLGYIEAVNDFNQSVVVLRKFFVLNTD